jgi:hypothetical protein
MKFKNSSKKFSIYDIVKHFVENQDKLTSVVIDVERLNNKVFVLTIEGCNTKFSKTFNYRFIQKKNSKFKFEEYLIMDLLLELSDKLFKNGIDFCICFPVTNFPAVLKPRPSLNDLLSSTNG